MVTKKTTTREGELELSRGGAKKNRLVIISAVIVLAAVLPLILFNTVLANHRPVARLGVQSGTIRLGESRQIICVATDADGDELTYNWSATGGVISGQGVMVTWTAPEEIGIYHVTVVVTDGHGGEDTRSIYLSAVIGTPVTIEDLIVTAEHQYLKKTATGYKVGKTKEYDIECITANTSAELVYEWSCTGGQISGEGSMITWTAPDVSVEITVTVVVTDVADNTVSKSIILDVVPCSACIFG